MERKNLFCIGFHKTGTSSLSRALYILGYYVTGFFGTDEDVTEEELLKIIFERMEKYNAVQDTPWFVYYKLLDKHFPNSKFILTLRDEEKWIKSIVQHFGTKPIKAHELIYGVPYAQGYEDVYLERYRNHTNEVREYFKDRPNDLLEIDITKGDGWEKICPYLGFDIPPIDFPLVNPGSAKRQQIIARIKQQLYWKVPGFERMVKGDEINVKTWITRDDTYDYYFDMDQTWPTHTEWQALDSKSQAEYLSNISNLAYQNRQLLKTIYPRMEIGFETMPITYDGSQSYEAVKAYWESTKMEFRHFVSCLDEESLFVYHPELKQKSHQVIYGIIGQRPLKSPTRKPDSPVPAPE